MPDTNPSQAEATRVVAEQLFDTWEARQDRKAKEARRWFGSSIAGWLTAAALIIGAIVAGGNTYDLATDANARSIRNENSISAMKVENSDRLGRIETKLDILIKERER